MKVLTITTQFANNYGALLQCYALHKYIASLDGCECEVIDYLPSIHGQSWGILRKPSTLKDLAKIIYSLLKIRFVLDKHAKDRLVRDFINNHIQLTKQSYNRESILSNPPQADAYVCGSDQIWNEKIFKNDYTYYLDFVKSGKRIAYAASMADPWPHEFEGEIAPSLKKFNAISLREKGNISQAQANVPEIDIKWVADPVFLLGKGGWDEVVKEPSLHEPYIFCYFLNVDPFAVDVVNKLRTITGYKVVNLALDALDKFHSDIVFRRADPLDFVGYIKKASYICTNSFHCSAFSTIYEKSFAFIPKSWANERILSLQEIFGLDVIMTKEKYDNLTTEMFVQDYQKCREKGNAFIAESKEFLNKALYGEIS